MWLFTKSKNKISSRKQIQIKEVRDDILILPNNKYRLILETSSINFELKSDEEQDVLIESFQNFLNSNLSPLQICIRIREVDVDKYLEEISKTKAQEKEKVYKDQLTNYCEFIKNIVIGNKILSRKFYIIIPYYHIGTKNDFQLIKEQMYLNRDLIIRGLEKLGMKAKMLNSLELLDMFYTFYNQPQAKSQELKNYTLQLLQPD